MNTFLDSAEELLKSAVGMLFGRAFGAIALIISEILIVRALEPNSYGDISLAYTIVNSIALLSLFGISDGITRQMSVDVSKNNKNKLIQGAYIVVISISILAAVSLLTTRTYMGKILQNPEIPRLLLLFSPFLIFFTLSKVTFGILRAQKGTLDVILSNYVGSRLSSLLLLIFFFEFAQYEIGAMIYWITIPLFSLLYGVYFVKKRSSVCFEAVPSVDWEQMYSLVKFSWPLAVSSTFFLLLANLDILMIGYFLDSRQVGYYRSIQPLRKVPTFVLGAFTFLFLPIATNYFDDKNIDELEKLYKISTKWSVYLTFPAVLVFIFFPESTIITFFGKDYTPASPVLQVLAGGLFFRTIVGLNGDIVRAINATKIELYSAGLGVISNFLLNIYLIPTYGITGAAISTVFGYIVYNLIEVGMIYHHIKIHAFSARVIGPLIAATFFTALLATWAGDQFRNIIQIIGITFTIGIILIIFIPVTSGYDEMDEEIFQKIIDEL